MVAIEYNTRSEWITKQNLFCVLMTTTMDQVNFRSKRVQRDFAATVEHILRKQNLKHSPIAQQCTHFRLEICRKIAGGYWSQEREGVLDQELLGISVYTIDRRGNLGIQVRIATEDWARLESQHVVKIEILTNYQPLVELSRKLLALLDGRIEAAIL